MTRSISVVSCVSDAAAYAENVTSSLPADGAEYIPVDNTANRHTAAEALNRGWSQAGGDLIVFCHQDVVFPTSWLDRLCLQITRVEELGGPEWGVAGTFGRRGKRNFGHIHDRYGNRREGDELPARVETLDENCLIVRRDLPFRFDESLGGFHFYGVDICLTARSQRLWNWALDCPLRHLGEGNKDESYYALRRRLERKWRWQRWLLGATRRVHAKMHAPHGPLHFGLHHALTR